jgi:large subunit ribosomal protein L9
VQVILLSDVDNLGLRGDVVDVAPGYARNFLLPRGLAESATAGRIAQVRRLDELRARQEARTVEHAQEIADTLMKTVLRFEVNAGPTGSLFGSVTPTDIVDELWRVRRIRVDRRKIDLPEPIKRVGRYEIPIDVFEEVRVDVKTLVVPEGGELPPEEEEAAEAAETGETAEPAGAEGESAGAAIPGPEPVAGADPVAVAEPEPVAEADALAEPEPGQPLAEGEPAPEQPDE